ncbi:MAG: Arm DNA-binding domain-containing protein, partial [Pseudomonadota bacterium]|nr:Arm DNA-binding domain-containing protein [Pseudomonadota bacterium]
MVNQINFTKAALDSLPVPDKGKRAYHYDAKTRGLAVQITSTGAKTFYVYRWVAGRPERIRLGVFPDVTIEQARRKAAEVNGEIARGENPNDKRRALRAEMTMEELFLLYLE